MEAASFPGGLSSQGTRPSPRMGWGLAAVGCWEGLSLRIEEEAPFCFRGAPWAAVSMVTSCGARSGISAAPAVEGCFRGGGGAVLSLGWTDTVCPIYPPFPWRLCLENGEQLGLGFSFPFTRLVPMSRLVSGFTFNQGRILDSLLDSEALLALVPSPWPAGTLSLAPPVGGSLGGWGPSTAVAGPASGFAPEAEAMARLSLSPPGRPFLLGVTRSCRANSSRDPNSTLLSAWGAGTLRGPGRCAKIAEIRVASKSLF